MAEIERCKAFPACKVRIKGNRYCAKHRCCEKKCEEKSFLAVNGDNYCQNHNVCCYAGCTNGKQATSHFCRDHNVYKCSADRCNQMNQLQFVNGQRSGTSYCKDHACTFSLLPGVECCTRESLTMNADPITRGRRDNIPHFCSSHQNEFTNPHTRTQIMNKLRELHFDYFVNLTEREERERAERVIRENQRRIEREERLRAEREQFRQTRTANRDFENLFELLGLHLNTEEPRNEQRFRPVNTEPPRPRQQVKSMEINAESQCCICLDQLISQPFRSYECTGGAMHAIHTECEKAMNQSIATTNANRNCTLCV